MHEEPVASADTRLEQWHFAVDAFGADPGLPFRAVEPSREDAGVRRVEDTDDLEHWVSPVAVMACRPSSVV